MTFLGGERASILVGKAEHFGGAFKWGNKSIMYKSLCKGLNQTTTCMTFNHARAFVRTGSWPRINAFFPWEIEQDHRHN